MNEKDLIRSNSCVTISLSEILPQHSVFVSISPRDGAGFSLLVQNRKRKPSFNKPSLHH